MNLTVDDYECAQNLSHECAMCIINRDCEQCAICADSMHVVRHAIVVDPIDIPIIIDAFLLLNIQIRMRSSGHIDVLQWNRE